MDENGLSGNSYAFFQLGFSGYYTTLLVYLILIYRFVRLKYRAKTGDLAVRLRTGESLPSLRAALAAHLARAAKERDASESPEGKLSSEAALMRTGQERRRARHRKALGADRSFAMPPMDACRRGARRGARARRWTRSAYATCSRSARARVSCCF